LGLMETTYPTFIRKIDIDLRHPWGVLCDYEGKAVIIEECDTYKEAKFEREHLGLTLTQDEVKSCIRVAIEEGWQIYV
jgi:hypothetical protein